MQGLSLIPSETTRPILMKFGIHTYWIMIKMYDSFSLQLKLFILEQYNFSEMFHSLRKKNSETKQKFLYLSAPYYLVSIFYHKKDDQNRSDSFRGYWS